jgi:tRNA-Thr(GGU) m(6)t(6)A37 methyltransferase TsaA
MELRPIGVIRSPVRSRHDMPVHGVVAEAEIFPECAAALEGIEQNSHLILICWMHEADRTVLRAVARKVSSDLPEKGVFSLRSPARPNPVSVSVVRLLGVDEERFLKLAYLDLIDGTPVIDLKPYQPGWDCVFSATNHDRIEKIQRMTPDDYRESLIREAVNYHGEICPGVAAGVRIAEAGTHILKKDLRMQEISLIAGADPCITDALIGITGARPGNRRLIVTTADQPGNRYVIATPDREVVFRLRVLPTDVALILSCSEESLFDLEIRTERENRAGD